MTCFKTSAWQSAAAIPLIGLFLVLCFSVGHARTTQSLNTNWKFNKSDVTNGQSSTVSDASWQTVHVPHTVQYENYHMPNYDWEGVVWYRKSFTIDASAAGKKIFLRFEGAMTVAQVYINGTLVTTHLGGYTPFTIDITPQASIGSTNLLAVRLDNTYKGDIPPEKPDHASFDYLNFGGLYRNVDLIISDKLHVPDPVTGVTAQGGTFITTPSVSTTAATVSIKTVVKNDYTSAKSCVLKTTILDKSGTVVATVSNTQSIAANGSYTFLQTTTINNPSLWSPVSPSLYTARSEVSDNTTPVDTFTTRFGVRSIRFDRTNGFYLNGTRLKLLGLNRHQTFPYVGNALPDNAHRRDVGVLKAMGCNVVRLSHYPQSPSTMDALDSLGIMCWVEVPTWMGWNLTTAWKNQHYQHIRDMIRRDRNHPSVILWGIGINEGDNNADFEAVCQQVAKSEDSTHPTTSARNYMYGGNRFDVYGGNRFLVSEIPTALPDAYSQSFFNSEYVGHTFITARYNSEAHLVEHAHRHAQIVGLDHARSFISGGTGWCAFDYNSRFGSAATTETVYGDQIPGNGICYHGVSDLFRIPKFAYYFYRSQSAPDNYDGSKHPMVFIASYANYSMPSTQTITVYSNCQQVELFVNGTSVGTRSPVTPDQGTLEHPWFVFTNVNFSSPGTLRADGKIGGAVVATHTRLRPGSAAKVALSSDADTLRPDGTDLALVTVSILDAQSTLCPTAANTVTVSATGAGKVICGSAGPQNTGTITVEAGQLAFLVQAGLSAGTVTVTATASGLTQAQKTIVVAVPQTVAVQDRGRKPAGQFQLVSPLCVVRNNLLTISGLDKTGHSTVELLAMNGRVVSKISAVNKATIAVTTKEIPAGIYTARIQSGASEFSQNLIVVH